MYKYEGEPVDVWTDKGKVELSKDSDQKTLKKLHALKIKGIVLEAKEKSSK